MYNVYQLDLKKRGDFRNSSVLLGIHPLWNNQVNLINQIVRERLSFFQLKS